MGAAGRDYVAAYRPFPWQYLYFVPDPHEQRSFGSEALFKISPVLLARRSPPGLISMSTEMATNDGVNVYRWRSF